MERSKNDSRNIAVMIVSNGRPYSVVTYDTLRRSGYSGRIFIVVDDEDDCADSYLELYGTENVLMYSKERALQEYDLGMVSAPRKLGGCARSQCHRLAAANGLTHFIIVDDDMYSLSHKYFINSHSAEFRVRRFDDVARILFDFLDVSGALAISPAQGGDFIGGAYNKSVIDNQRAGWDRKCMNMFFCRTDRPLRVYGALNSDVTSYVMDGIRGKLYFTAYDLLAHYSMTQQSNGGMTPTYERFGTYVKSFMTVMHAPSCVNVSILNGGGIDGNPRIHHHVEWGNCTPVILSDQYRKECEKNNDER